MNGLLDNPKLILGSVFIGIAIFMVVTFLIKLIAREQIAVNDRKSKLMDVSNTSMRSKDGSEDNNHRRANSSFLDRLSKLGVTTALGQELLVAGIMVRPEEFLAIWAAAFIFGSGGFFLFSGFNFLVTLIIAAAIVIAPIFIIRSKKSKKYKLFDDQLSDALMMMSNCLVAGLSFQQAMENIAREMPDPISGEFSRTLKEMRFGKSTEDALEDLIARVPSSDLMIAINAILIQHQVGGNLSEILTTIADTIRDRHKIFSDIKVLTTQGKMSAIVISVLPIVMFLMVSLISPGYTDPFFEHDLGPILLFGAIFMEVTGILVVKNMIKIDF